MRVPVSVVARVITLFALVAVTAGMAAAQSPLGRLAGTVFDASNAVLPGATVTATNEQTNQSQTVVTSPTGAYLFPQLQPGTYKVAVELAGFKTSSHPGIVISTAQETSLTVRLEIGELAETVTVTAGSPLVQTTTPEISRTVEQRQILMLPINSRDMTLLIRMQAGVPGVSTRMNTAINGGRATWTQVTQDGINIQDNFIRTNSLDFLPNRPTSDNTAEFTTTSSVAGADVAGGATAVRMVTPSGSNVYRGSVFESNRDNALAANSFFNNKSGVPKAVLKRNQFGGRIGGPIQKNKVFFFGYYEAFRQKSQTAQNNVIPVYDDLLTGAFRYVRTSDGQVGTINVLQSSGLTLDPTMQQFLALIPKASNVNNYDTGNSRAGQLLNTAGYRFNQTDLQNRDYVTGRVDYEVNQDHHLEVIGSIMRETDDRTDLDTITLPRPKTYTWSNTKRFVAAWRWLASPRLQNEVRGGFNLAPVTFENDEEFPDTIYNPALNLNNRVVTFQPQGRYTNTYQLNDNANFSWGDHAMQFGGSWQRVRINPYNYAGQFPTVTFGFSSVAPGSVQLNSGHFPGGIAAADVTNANALLSMLSGTISSLARTFQVKDQTSGYVPGIPSDRNYTLDNVAAYFQDNWRVKPNLTLRLGLKWEYYSPLTEDKNLGFLPQLAGKAYKDVLRDPNATIGFINGGVTNKDLNNFGPTVGFAWDVFKDGRTSVRGGYSLTFVNEEGVTVGTNIMGNNAGLSTGVTLSNQYARLAAGVPTIPTPTFKSERTLADQMALSATGTMAMIDPDIQQPKVHQVSVGIQRELMWGLAAEARYVGTFARGIWRGVDLNQLTYSSAFSQDFQRARANGFLSLAATGVFNPAYNSAISGSQPLTVIPTFGGGYLTNSTVRTAIQQNEVGALADYYVTARVPGALATFFQNGGIYQAWAMENSSFQDYNALQLELRRQFRGGFMGGVNYTFSHMRADSTGGTSQSRLEALLDNARPKLNEGRSPADIRHIINANFVLELPFGRGKRWLDRGGIVDAIVGGWQTSGIIRFQSGSPVGITSGRATFNRAGRSGLNTASTTLSTDQIKKLFKVYKLPDGRIFWLDPALVDTTGRAVGADTLNNTAGFTGQQFFNPVAGEVGNLPIYAWDAPIVWNMDLMLAKRVRFRQRYSTEFRVEALNALNNVCFYAGDYGINSTTFGRITGTAFGARVIQLSLRLDF